MPPKLQQWDYEPKMWDYEPKMYFKKFRLLQ